MSRCLFEIADGVGYTCVVEPGLTAAQIQLAQGCGQPLLQQHLAEVLSLGQIRHIGVALQPLPAHSLELCTERFLDEVVFPLDLHSVAQLTLRWASPTLPAATLVQSFLGRARWARP